ncbi:hypothetical protein LV156_009005 [Aspergillus fumigatus]|nr:hypothetical protein LV156_009005 [Aspergillus fumigatus]KAJ8228663.1 hypothetical protein LV160_008733 [Aspergillus fumigatus]
MDVTGRPLVFGCLLEELYETGGERCTDGESFSSVVETVEAVRGPVQKCLMPKEIQMDGRDEQPLLMAQTTPGRIVDGGREDPKLTLCAAPHP